MTIKAWLAGGLAIVTTVGTAIVANDIGDAIETNSRIKEQINDQRLVQEQKEWEAEQEIREELIQEKIDFQEGVYYTLKYVTPVTLVAIFATTLYLFAGWSEAEVRKAKFEATQVKMDKETRTFPLICFEAAGKLRIHDPNSMSTLALEVDRDVSPLLLANSTAVQLQSMANQNEEVHLPVLLEMANNYLNEERIT